MTTATQTHITRPPRPCAEIIQFPRSTHPLTEEEFLAQDRTLAARIDALRELFEAKYAAEAAVNAARPPAKILQFRPRAAQDATQRSDQDIYMKPGPCPCASPCFPEGRA